MIRRREMKRNMVAKLAVVGMLAGCLAWSQAMPGQPMPGQQMPGQQMPDQTGTDPADTAGPGVARVSLMNGEVSVRRGDSGDLVAAVVNAPLMAGDHVLTGPNARAEVQFEFGNMVRLDAQTDLRIANLQNGVIQLQIAAGTVTYNVLRDSSALPEIDTPSVAVRPTARGAYRISVDQDGQSAVTVRAGSADINSPRGNQPLQAGQTMYARGDAADPEFQVANAIPRDGWDAWNEQRDQTLARSKSYQHVSPNIQGAEDLDANGRWIFTPDYGWVWTPNVQPGWAPYRDGTWAWQDYYGWNWVGYEPWGWAPYHYGRWFMGPVGWCWYPGGIGRPFYRPALVGFFGFGPGIGVGLGFGFGSIGWVPLAPFERFHPWYGAGYFGGGFGSHIAMVNNVNIVNTYRNARVANGVSGMGVNQFGHGRTGIAPVAAASLRQGTAMHGALPVTPSAASLHYSNRAASNSGLARTAFQQRGFAGSRPTAATSRTSFAQQQRGMEQAQRSFSSSAGRSTTSTTTAGQGGWRSVGAAGRTTPAAPSTQGNVASWQRFGGAASGTRSTAAPQVRTAPSTSGGWRAFSGPSTQGRVTQPQSSNGQVRISPPIVRGRSTPSGASSAPQYQSAPAPQYHPSTGGSTGSHPAGSGHTSGGSSHGRR